MRILTVRQPWAWAIIRGGKDVENRVRNIAGDYRGPVAIHVAKSVGPWNEREAALQAVHLITGQDVRKMIAGGPRSGGHIIGVVDLVDVHVARAAASGRLVDWADHTKPGEQCSPWAEWDSHHLVLANPRALNEPIPYKGALGLRNLAVHDPATTARILAQIGQTA